MQEMTLDKIKGITVDFSSLMEKEVTIKGMIQNLRVLSWGAFLILRTPGYTLQTIIDKENINIPLEQLMVESAVIIKGIVKSAKIKDKALFTRDCEIHVKEITVISSPACDVLPVDTTKKEMVVHLDKKFDLRPLTLRHTSERAIFKIAATI